MCAHLTILCFSLFRKFLSTKYENKKWPEWMRDKVFIDKIATIHNRYKLSIHALWKKNKNKKSNIRQIQIACAVAHTPNPTRPRVMRACVRKTHLSRSSPFHKSEVALGAHPISNSMEYKPTKYLLLYRCGIMIFTTFIHV